MVPSETAKSGPARREYVSIPFSSGLWFRGGTYFDLGERGQYVSIPFSSGLWFRADTIEVPGGTITISFQSPFHRGCGSEVIAKGRDDKGETNVSIPFSSGLWFRAKRVGRRKARLPDPFQSPFHRGCGSEGLKTCSKRAPPLVSFNPLFIGAVVPSSSAECGGKSSGRSVSIPFSSGLWFRAELG